MAPVVHGLEQQWGEKVGFVYLDIDDPRTAPFKRALGYQYQPHILLLDVDGQVVHQWVGFVRESELQEALKAIAG
jgi:thioredoxin-like negative regulator of GroEL